MRIASKKNKYANRDKGSLTLSVLILGVLSLISAGIIALSAIEQWSPKWVKAAVNKELNYQGKLQDSSGVPVADGAYNIIFTIYDASAGGNVVWSARESDAGCGGIAITPSAKSITISNGVFSTLLGESGDCAISLNFSASAYFLGVTVGADAEMTPRKRIGASLYSFNADMLDDLDESAFGRLAQDETVAGSWSLGDANTDTLTLTAYINSNLYLGANAETLANAGFSLSGNDAFIADLLGVEGNIYTDGSLVVGDATTYGANSITTTGAVDFTLNPAGGDVIITDDNLVVDTSTLYVSAGDNRVGINDATPLFGLDIVSTDERTINSLNEQAAGYAGYFTASGATAYAGYFTATDAGNDDLLNYGIYASTYSINGYAGYFNGGYTAVKAFTADPESAGVEGTGVLYGGYFSATGVDTTYGVLGSVSSATGYAGYFTGGLGVYTDTAFLAGATTSYGIGTITTTAANDLALNPGGDVTIPDGDNFIIDTDTLYVNTTLEQVGINRAPTALYTLDVLSPATDERTINVENSHADGYAGYFTASGTGGAYGLYVDASGATGNNFGIFSTTSSDDTYTGYFDGGQGIYSSTSVDFAYAVTGFSVSAINGTGGYFASSGEGGVAYGVLGTATGLTGTNYGVYGQVASTTGFAGFFSSNANTGLNYGVYSTNDSSTGYAGYFTATDDDNADLLNYGIYASTSSSNGYAGYFTGGLGTYTSSLTVGAGTGVLKTTAGAVTADAALDDLGDVTIAAPGVGEVLKYDGANWINDTDATGGAPGGADTQIQYNNSGAFGGDAGLTYVAATDTLTIAGGLVVDTSTLYVDAGNNRVGINDATPLYGLDIVSTDGRTINSLNEQDTGHAGHFTASGTGGAYGLYVNASGVIGVNYGIHAIVASNTGIAGRFEATGNSGTNYGVWGSTLSSIGYSGYFIGGTLYADRANIGRIPSGEDRTNAMVIQGALCVDDAVNTCPNTGTAGNIYAENVNINDIDLAENFASTENLEPGDVVSVDPNNNEQIVKSKTSNDNTVMGVVSTKPGLLLGGSLRPGAYPVALAGRVPVKVSNENGPIARGDKLTSSSTPGVAMKADRAPYIGLALESFDEASGVIIAFINLDWSGETNPGNENFTISNKLTGNLDANNFSIINIKKLVGINEKWSIDENGILKVRLTNNGFDKEMFGLSSTNVELTLSGSSKLQNGEKIIDLNEIDKEFVKNISDKTPLKIILTMTEAGNGIYVAEKTQTGFRVKELNNGMSNSAFDWLVIARRSGYDDPAPEAPAPAPAVEAPPIETPAAPAPAPEAPEEPAPVDEPALADSDEPPTEVPPAAPEAPAVEVPPAAPEEVAPPPAVEAPAVAPEAAPAPASEPAPAEAAPAAE